MNYNDSIGQVNKTSRYEPIKSILIIQWNRKKSISFDHIPSWSFERRVFVSFDSTEIKKYLKEL